MYKSVNSLAQFQNFGSILGFLLPILQIFLQFLPGVTNNILLIKNHFLLISVFAAIFSYMLITVLRNFAWFDLPLNKKSHKKYYEQLAKTDPRIYSQEDIQKYYQKNPRVDRPFYITPNNIFLLTLPIVLISFLTFFGLGMVGESITETNNLLIFFQALAYIILISSTTITLATYYIRDLNSRKHVEKEKARVQNIMQLAFENNVFNELPHVSLIAQWGSGDFLGGYTFIFKVESKYYVITSDGNGDKINSVEMYNSYQELLNKKQGRI